MQTPLTWEVPGGNYRGGGIWIRYTDGENRFSAVEEADFNPERLSVSPTSLLFLAEYDSAETLSHTLTVETAGCEPFTWTVSSAASWLDVEAGDEEVIVSVKAAGLVTGTYYATVTVEAGADVLGSPVHVHVTLIVTEGIHWVYLPLVSREYR